MGAIVKLGPDLGLVLRRPPTRFARQFGLGRGKACDRDAVGRARDVVEPDLAAEMDRGRVAAMLAADAEFDAGPRRAAALGGDAHHLADALNINADKRIALDDA